MNYNEAAKAGAAVYTHPSMTPEDKRDWRSSLDRSKHPEGTAGDEAYRQGIRRSGTHLKEQHPEMTPQVDEAMKKYGADKGAGLDAKATTEQKKGAAAGADGKAKQKDAKNDDASTKMAELLKKRQAAASVPKPSS